MRLAAALLAGLIFVVGPSRAQTLSPSPIQHFVDSNGNALSGGKLFTYAAGTTTKLGTFVNSTGTPNTNPIILNTRGEAQVWLGAGPYKFVLSPSTDSDPPTNPIWTVDQLQVLSPAVQITDHKTGIQSASNNTFTISSDGTTVASIVGANIQDDILAVVSHTINGSTLTNLNAIAGYVLNDNGVGSGLAGNAVALYGFGESDVTNAWTWGLNTITISKVGIGANHQISIEADVNAVNTTDNVIGVQISGGSTVTPTNAEAIVVTPVGPGIPWGAALFTQPGAATDVILGGALSAAGTNVNSQAIILQVLDSGGLTQTWNEQATPTSLNFFSSVTNPAFQFNGNVVATAGRAYQIGPDTVIMDISHAVTYGSAASITSLAIGNGIVPVQINSTAFQLTQIATASLPACNSGAKGYMYTVTDASSPTYNAVLSGGSTSVVPVMCDGTNWRTH